ncbi:MAG: alcohol dehydrogenase catalytic domain-containing protein [Rhodobacteraceae bacterium]|nr:alcohol dehydrogenase catalytic domain-containing protein [Paracoccaceae bacterium]
MESMKAAVLIKPRIFEIRDIPIPEIGSDDVLVKISRCGICGTDIHIFHGKYAAESLPLVPGHEFSGEIVEIGSNVTHLSMGQKVVANINIGCGHCYWCRRNEILNCPDMQQVGITRDGAFAEFVAIPARLVIPAPPNVPDEVLALVEPVACVVRAARKSGIKFGQSVVILGFGPIGNLHVQMMRLVGAAPIIASDVSKERVAMAKGVGADAVVSNPAELKELVLAMTDGRGADVVIESVGISALYQQAFDLIRKGGHVAAFGLTSPGDTVPLDILRTILEENSMKGSVAGMGEDMHDALTLLTHQRFDTRRFTDAHYALEDIQNAFDSIPERPEDLKTQIIIE